MAAQKLFLNLYLVSGGEPVVFEFPATSAVALTALCQSIRDSWASGQSISIQNPGVPGTGVGEYVNSAHVVRFSVS